MWIKTQFNELVNLSQVSKVWITYYPPVCKYAVEAKIIGKKKNFDILAMFNTPIEAHAYFDKLVEKLGAEVIDLDEN